MTSERRGSRLAALRNAFATPSAATLAILGFGSALPFLPLGFTLSTWLREEGFDLKSIGLVSVVSLAYTFKFAWAPVLDRWSLPGFSKLGRRRGWLAASILVVMAALAGMGVIGPTASLGAFLACMTVAAVAGATQDAVVDAYRIEIAPIDAQAALAATYTLGYRIGLIVGGAGALYLAQLEDFRFAYLVLAGLMAIPLATTLLAREPDVARVVQRPTAREAFVGPFRDFFSKHGMLLATVLLVFVGLYKLPDQMLGVLTGPFYLDSGFDKAEIASVAKLYGVWMGIAGAFAGGFCVALVGLRASLLVAAIAVALSNLLFITMAFHPGEIAAFVLAISGDNFSQGFAGTVIVAFMSALADRQYTATHYALLSSLANLPGKLIGGVSGYIAEAWGYIGFFVFSSVSIVPTLVLLAWLWRRIGPATGAEPAASRT